MLKLVRRLSCWPIILGRWLDITKTPKGWSGLDSSECNYNSAKLAQSFWTLQTIWSILILTHPRSLWWMISHWHLVLVAHVYQTCLYSYSIYIYIFWLYIDIHRVIFSKRESTPQSSEDQIVQSDFWKPPNFFLFNPLFVLECVINGWCQLLTSWLRGWNPTAWRLSV